MQLFKALEHQYQLGLEGLHTDLPQITCDLEFKARRLQLRPPLEDLRTEFYREIKKFIAIPPSFKVHHVAPGLPLSESWRAARGVATSRRAERALFVLGDMPFVSTDTLRALVNNEGGSRACTFNGIPMPPALLTAHDLRHAPDQDEDQGARELLRALPPKSLIPLSAEEASDIDTPEDLRHHRVNVRREDRA
ncbi:NTP transferase domain-containing protein [Thioclava electrotropha]|uniref:NTP transferase domain-containing protein n=1 Tax=Thioclava electrotropha TaxID=1549850 RepID=UPI0023A83C5D|nr:NTP transferase domain-containing protein [Thioclava electrotropha]